MLMAAITLPLSITAEAASCKLPKSYFKHVSCTASAGYFLATKDYGAPVALIDNRGKIVVDLMGYQRADGKRLAEGLLPILRNSRVGYVNLQGREVIPPIYDTINEGGSFARAASDGKIVVKRDGQFGVINGKNQTIVPFSKAISNIDNFNNGHAKVYKGKAVSWVNSDGNPTADPTKPRATSSAASAVSNPKNPPENIAVNQNTQKPAPPKAPFTTLQAHQQDGRWGFVDDDGTIMITYSFDEARPFSEGLAAVRIADEWGFLNLGGDLVVPFSFQNSPEVANLADNYFGAPSFVFNQGKAWVATVNGQKQCIDKKFAEVACDF